MGPVPGSDADQTRLADFRIEKIFTGRVFTVERRKRLLQALFQLCESVEWQLRRGHAPVVKRAKIPVSIPDCIYHEWHCIQFDDRQFELSLLIDERITHGTSAAIVEAAIRDIQRRTLEITGINSGIYVRATNEHDLKTLRRAARAPSVLKLAFGVSGKLLISRLQQTKTKAVAPAFRVHQPFSTAGESRMRRIISELKIGILRTAEETAQRTKIVLCLRIGGIVFDEVEPVLELKNARPAFDAVQIVGVGKVESIERSRFDIRSCFRKPFLQNPIKIVSALRTQTSKSRDLCRVLT